MMRIISGDLKGRVLKVPDRPGLRPSQDRLRAGLFSALENLIDLTDLKVLDLYAGSGSLGIEAVSRGAGSCHFIEADRILAEILKQHLDSFDIGSRCKVVNGELPSALDRVPHPIRYDLVLADPPYSLNGEELPRELTSRSLIRVGTHLVYESRKGSKPLELSAPAPSLSLRILKERRYGDSVVTFYVFE